MNKTELILIDIQMDYFSGGPIELHEPEAAANKAKDLLSLFRAQALPVVHIQHETTDINIPIFQAGTQGQKIPPSVTPFSNETVLIKHTPNSFFQTELLDVLNDLEVDRIVICGMMTHQCVNHTARTAKELGFDVTVIGDACTTRAHTYDGVLIPAKQVQNAHLAGLEGFIATLNSTNKYIEGFNNNQS